MKAPAVPDWSGFRNKLKVFVNKRVKDSSVAEDIVHDVLLKAQTNLARLNEPDKFVGWVYRIARNTIADHFRRKSMELRREDLDWESTGEELNECVAHCLKETMATLPVLHREALELTELMDVPQLELAQRLSISYSGAKSRVQRARRMLRKEMEKQYRIETDRYGRVLVCENRTPRSCHAESCR